MEPDSIHLLVNLFVLLSTGFLPVKIIISLFLIIILLCGSALVSGSEIAFFSLTHAQITEIKTFKTSSSLKILKLLDKPKHLLATILISNNFINIAIVILSTFITAHYVHLLSNPLIGFLIQVVLITFLLLLFGEILPKILAHRYALPAAQFFARPILFLRVIFYPLSSIMVRFGSFIDNRIEKKHINMTSEDLFEAIELSTHDKTTTEDERKMLKGIAKFSNIEVKEIMKSRIDVVAIEESTSFDKLLHFLNESAYSRIPVYSETFDNITGILYVKDLLKHLDEDKDFNWRELLRTPFFVPENKGIDDLLKEFQARKIHLSIVVDEYGGTSGIVTLEDIIEEIVGEINDEFDVDEVNYQKINENTYIFEGKISLNDFCKIIEIDDGIFDKVRGDSDSLAGLVLELSGKIPQKNERIDFENMTFIAETVDKRRIKKVKVVIVN
ncbi:MAG: gliding motility-associated protein GldE [Bacteroidales bacterium]|nr:gliding motility-associated protein GldE [Bacteroidales bacterium]